MLAALTRRAWFTLTYWLPGKPPWDSGISPPELVRVVEGAADTPPLPPGRALDLGCGTGTNVLYLAEHGWQATGIDFAGRAIALARAKARRAAPEVAARISLHNGDVTRLEFLQPPFDLALDMGCLHSLTPEGQARYAAGLARLLRPGGLYMLYAFKPEAGAAGGLAEEAVAQLFAPGFEVILIEQGQGRPSAWYTLRKL